MTAPRFRKTKWHGMDNYACNACGYATLDRGIMVEHVRTKHPTPAEVGGEPHPLAGVEFASDEAMELALEAGLTAGDLAGHTPTGRGGYVVGDVRAIIAASAPGSPEEPTEDPSGPAEDSATPDPDTPDGGSDQ